MAWRWSVLGIAAAGVMLWGFARHKARFRKPDCILLAVVLALGVVQVLPLPLVAIRWISPHRYQHLAAASRVLGPIGSATLSSVPVAARDKILTLAAYAIAFLLLCELRRRYNGRPWVLAAPILAVGFLEAVLGIAQCAAGAELATGTYVDRNHFAGLLEMSLPFAVMLGVQALTRWWNRPQSPARPAIQACLCFGAAAVMIASVIGSQSRMGFTASLLALFVIAVLALSSQSAVRGARRRRGLALALTGAAILLAFLFLPSEQLRSRFGDLAEPDNQKMRTDLWKETLPLIADYPAIGCGLGAFESCFLPYKSVGPEYIIDYPHDDYLQVMAEFGLPAFGCLAALAALAYGTALRRTRAGNPGRWLAIACVGALSAILLHAFVDFNLNIPANGLLAVWVAAMAREA
jgi:O-antigen ligase